MDTRGRPTPSDAAAPNRRVLVVDDTPSIHDDFRKILAGSEESAAAALAAVEAELFGAPETSSEVLERFHLEHAHQGDAGVEMVAKARAAGQPYALAFVDVRMPPGIDGVVAASRMWQQDPDLHVVICTAHSDYS